MSANDWKLAKAEPLDTSDCFSPYKVLAYPEVLVAAKNDAPLRPINLEINPVNVCNHSCTWCTYGYLHDRRERLEKRHILELLADAKELGVQSVTWTGGGEPTVCRWLSDVIDAAIELGFRQGINSNGSHLSERLIEQLVGHFTYIRFSIDAGTAPFHAKTHQVKEEAFDRVIRNVGRLAERKRRSQSELTIGYSFLIDDSNVEDMGAAIRLARSLGVDYIQFKPIVHYSESNEQFAQQSRLWERIDAQLAPFRADDDPRCRIRLLGHKFRDVALQQSHWGRTYETCRGNELLATVGADGSVDVCCAYKGVSNWSFGNIRERRFTEIWGSEQRQAILKQIDVKQCPPLCKAHEINKVLHYVRNFDKHRDFV